MWNESRQMPSAGWSAAATIRHAWSYSLTCRPQASASYAICRPRSAARSARAWSCSAASASSSIASWETFEQTSMAGAPSSSITSNLASARRRLRSRVAAGTASKSRNGW